MTTPASPTAPVTALRPPTGRAPRTGRSRRRMVALGVAILLVAAIVVVVLVAFSPVFGVRTVRVTGVHTVSAATVSDRAAIGHGTPLLRLDTSAVARRVERIPDIASARVTTAFPSTVTIAVTERTPVGFVRRAGRDVLVDTHGVQYRTVTARPHLPQLVLPSGSRTSRAVASVAASLPRALLTHVQSVQALNPKAITLVLTGGRLVRWGSADRSAAKGRVLPILLRRHDQTLFDVTDPDQPFSR